MKKHLIIFGKLIILNFLFSSLIFCTDKKDENEKNAENHPGWTRELFNLSYTIETPDTYTGGINYEAHGTTYQKNNDDYSVVIHGGFCDPAIDPCYASDFNGPGIDIQQDSIPYTNLHGNTAYLTLKTPIYDHNDVIGCFYYTNYSGKAIRDVYGKLILKDVSNYEFRMAGTISYASSKQDQVLQIVKSIKYN